jgi:anthranilate phosphoribosyltransferase
MTKSKLKETDAEGRMREYVGKIASGPHLSKNLTENEAEDALGLILNGDVSPIRSAVFLIASRMKLETPEENIGFWRALNKSSVKRKISLDRALQIADAFDGFERVPYFGFYAVPVIAALGLPCYGHSTLAMPPKRGITFSEILSGYYGLKLGSSIEACAWFLEEEGFCYLDLSQTHPKLESLRDLRSEMVKRSTLATFEKMLCPLETESGKNYLATTYFHRGYEIPMAAAANESPFQTVIIGNGMEGTSLYGVHKAAKIFRVTEGKELEEIKLEAVSVLPEKFGREIQESYLDLKGRLSDVKTIATLGLSALEDGRGPAAAMIAWQAGSIGKLFGLFSDWEEGYIAAKDVLASGKSMKSLTRFIDFSKNGS